MFDWWLIQIADPDLFIFLFEKVVSALVLCAKGGLAIEKGTWKKKLVALICGAARQHEKPWRDKTFPSNDHFKSLTERPSVCLLVGQTPAGALNNAIHVETPVPVFFLVQQKERESGLAYNIESSLFGYSPRITSAITYKQETVDAFFCEFKKLPSFFFDFNRWGYHDNY